ncbi:reverse transcriptase domain-containing protein [Tanacetum coccineum]
MVRMVRGADGDGGCGFGGEVMMMYRLWIDGGSMWIDGGATTHTERGDSVTSIKRRRRDLQSDAVKDFVTTSERSCLKEDILSSTWRRRHGFKVTLKEDTAYQRLDFTRKHVCSIPNMAYPAEYIRLVAAVLAAPPLVAALAAAATLVPLGSMAIVDRMEIKMDGMLKSADFVIEEGVEEAVGIGVDEIKNPVKEFGRLMDDLIDQSVKSISDIKRATTMILEKINEHPRITG